jgi:hypothetical protein
MPELTEPKAVWTRLFVSYAGYRQNDERGFSAAWAACLEVCLVQGG